MSVIEFSESWNNGLIFNYIVKACLSDSRVSLSVVWQSVYFTLVSEFSYHFRNFFFCQELYKYVFVAYWLSLLFVKLVMSRIYLSTMSQMPAVLPAPSPLRSIPLTLCASVWVFSAPVSSDSHSSVFNLVLNWEF